MATMHQEIDAEPEVILCRVHAGMMALRDMLESAPDGVAPDAIGLAVIIDCLARELPH